MCVYEGEHPSDDENAFRRLADGPATSESWGTSLLGMAGLTGLAPAISAVTGQYLCYFDLSPKVSTNPVRRSSPTPPVFSWIFRHETQLPVHRSLNVSGDFHPNNGCASQTVVPTT